MKIKLIYVTTVPITVKSFLVQEIRYMKTHGFDVEVVSSPGEELASLGIEEALPVHGILMPRGISPLGDLVALLMLWSVFRKLRPAIVHGSTAKAAFLSMLAATISDVPVRVYVMRGLMTEIGSGIMGKILRAVEWVTCRCSHQVIAVSRSVADTVVKENLCPDRKIKVMGKGSSVGIDADRMFDPHINYEKYRRCGRIRYGIPLEATVVGFVGRFVKAKGVVELYEAWKTVREKRREAILLMIGWSESRDSVPESFTRGLREDPRIFMINSVRRWDMPWHYCMMDILVLPTHREGFPNVVLEASAMELPVVATRVTGCVDAVLDGTTGTLVPVRDPAKLAEAIEAYVTDGDLRLRHGKAGREWVLEHFQPERLLEAYYEEYVRLLSQRGQPIPSE